MAHRISGGDLGRVVTFSDAVVAVAITLLVIPLVSVTAPGPDRPLIAVITDNWRQIVAFLLTFVIVYILWQGHHRIFENFAAIDDRIITLNGLWLLTVVFLPWPSRMLDIDGNGTQAVWLYCVTLFLNAALLDLIYRRGRRRADLLIDPDLWPRWSLSAEFALIFAALTVVALFRPQFALWALWVVIPLRFVAQQEGRLRSLLWPSAPEGGRPSAPGGGPDLGSRP